jgi:hypothetical protein
VIIPRRYNGPPGSANGGFSAGLFAGLADLPMEITLRSPPPLETPLTVVRELPGSMRMYAGGTLVAEALPVAPFDATVPPVSPAEAVATARSYAGFSDHPFPTCFVCGPDRPAGDGLRIFPGRLPDGRTAAPFPVPDEVSVELMWAALDCPGGWAIISPGRPYVLGRIAALVSALPQPGDVCVVVGRCVSAAGRKAEVFSTVYGVDGTPLAAAKATWIAVQAVE